MIIAGVILIERQFKDYGPTRLGIHVDL